MNQAQGFSNNGQKRTYGPSVNTGMAVFYSDTGRLKVGAWNERMTIEYSPRIVTGNGNATFSTEGTIKATLTRSEAVLLYKAINAQLMIENGEPTSISIFIGYGDSRKCICMGRNEEGKIFYKIYPSLLSTGEIDTERCGTFVFNNNVYMINSSDPNDDSSLVEVVQTEFYSFANLLFEFISNSSYTSHTIKYSEVLRNSLKQQNASNSQFPAPQQNNTAPYRAAQSHYDQGNFDFVGEDIPF